MNCPLCHPEKEKVLWENEKFYILDASSKDFPLFLRLIPKSHLKELSDLPPEDLSQLFYTMTKLEQLVIEKLNPTKINWASFGNMVPHLHWHLIARWSDDRFFPECPWGRPQKSEYSLSQSSRENECQSFKNNLNKLLSLN